MSSFLVLVDLTQLPLPNFSARTALSRIVVSRADDSLALCFETNLHFRRQKAVSGLLSLLGSTSYLGLRQGRLAFDLVYLVVSNVALDARGLSQLRDVKFGRLILSISRLKSILNRLDI